jgi:YebC/PmpR family DNA-binding regulatory protein
MSGHSKWHNIREKKGKVDAQRGKAFTKVSKEILIAAKNGGGDPNNNFALKNAILRAREVNMPMDNIKRVIDKATGGGDGNQFEEITYEGYGPHGVAMMAECTTDNRNRTAADMRHLFTKYGGNMGESGCVGWQFHKKGIIMVSKKAADEDKMMDVALGAGADDLKDSDDNWEVVTPPEAYFAVLEALENAKIKHESAELTMIPDTTVALEKDQARAVLKLMEMLEDHDDVQNVYANFDVSAEVMEEIMASA